MDSSISVNPSKPILWKDFTENTDIKHLFFKNMALKGYCEFKMSRSFRDAMRLLESNSKTFFETTSANEKSECCCEYIGESPSKTRDRLEIRVDRDCQTAFCSLSRNQFVAGYSPSDGSLSNKLLIKHFNSTLTGVHNMLEKYANLLLEILCSKEFGIDYSQFESLKSSLESERYTPGVLRLLRYLPNHPNSSKPKSESSELAQDHTDIGLITIMPYSSSETLQLLSPNFEWINVEKGRKCGSMCVIAGEQLAFISNYTLAAIRHRVIESHTTDIPQDYRFSFPFLMRAPPSLTLFQIGSNTARVSKEVLNHIFEFPEYQQTCAQALRELISTVENSDIASFVQIECVALAVPAVPYQPLASLDAILIVKSKIPTKPTVKKLVSMTDQGQLDEKDASQLEVRKRDYKFVGSAWSSELLSLKSRNFTFKSNGIHVKVLVVSWIDLLAQLRNETETSNVFADTFRSCMIVHGRQRLENMYQLNLYRLY